MLLPPLLPVLMQTAGDMSAAEVSPWKKGLKYLRQLTADSSDETVVNMATNEILWICSRQRQSTADMSEQACRKLVNELKWPLHACTAVAQAAQQRPKSPAVSAAVKLLEAFFSSSDAHLLETAGHVSQPSLQASARQQVEQSGLLQQLPPLMIAAAVELSVQAKDKSFLSYSQLLAARIAVPKTFYATSIRQHADQLLNLTCHTSRLWTGDDLASLQAQAGPAAAAMQLALAVTRHISAEVEEHMHNPGASQHSAFDTQDLMRHAYWAMSVVAMMVDQVGPSCGQQAMVRLLQAPQLVPCCVLQLTITALAVAMVAQDSQSTAREQHDSGGGHRSGGGGSSSSASSGRNGHQHRHAGSSGSGGSGSGGSGSGRGSPAGSFWQGSSSSSTTQGQQQQPLPATMAPPGFVISGKCPCCVDTLGQNWQLACERYSSLTPCHHKLFGLLGVDARAVLWAAAANRPHCRDLHTYSAYLSTYVEHVNLSLRTPLQLSPAAAPRQQLERQLHLLLPAVLMHHATALPAEHAGFTSLCLVAVQASTAAVSAWERLLLAPADEATADTEELLRYRPPDAEVGQLLRLGCTLSAGLQQRLSAAAPEGNAAAAAHALAAAQAAAAAAEAPMPEAALAQLGLMQLADLMCKVALHGVWMEPVLGPALGMRAVLAAIDTAGGEHSRPELQPGLFAVASLRDQAVEAMAAVERYTRSVGAAAAAGQPPQEGARLVVCNLLKAITGFVGWDGDQIRDGLRPGATGPLVALSTAAGPGSAAERQLISLFTSALKLVSGPFTSSTPGMELSPVYYGAAAASCAAWLLGDAGATAASVGAAAAAAEGGGSSGLPPGVVYLGLEELPPSAAPCDALDQLPWAVLFGRCCLLWAQQLQQELPALLEAQQEGGEQLTWQEAAEAAPEWSCYTACWCLREDPSEPGLSTMEVSILGVMDWLEEPGVVERLSAAGFQPQQPLLPVAQLLTARQEAADSSDPAALRELVQALQAAGQELCCLATRVCCNNPGCRSLIGPTELQLVSGKGCVCAGCRTARYCDRACQRAHWKRHKPVCQALAAAATTGAGSS